jgi:site-specific DNA recombinase
MRRSRSPSSLMGLIFDDRGNPMSPSHANKKGVRYRYYVSQALLQNRKSEAGSVSRVSGPDIENIVVAALRRAIADRNVAADDLSHPLISKLIVSGDKNLAEAPGHCFLKED